jgi:beta-xylosidase
MIKGFLFILLLVMAVYGCQEPSKGTFKPGAIWPDDDGVHINAHGGGFLFQDGVCYWFGEHKTAGKGGNKANVGVRCYSSEDLYHWKNEGVALAVHKDTNSLLVKGCIIERPKVIYNEKTGKYVMWFHHELKGMGYKAAMTGLAVADEVTGPYTYLRSVNPNAGHWPMNYPDSLKRDTITMASLQSWSDEWRKAVKEGLFVRRDFEKGQMARDMTLFVDTDGTAYHIHASEENQTLHVSELTDDYLGFTGRYSRILPGDSNEAPAVFKRGDKYYMIASGCTGWDPNPARSAVANHPFGPWKPLGNPSRGTDEQVNTTFESQSTFVLPVQGKDDAYIFMADRWRPENPIDGRYVWLPLVFEKGKPVIKWRDKWSLNVFD